MPRIGRDTVNLELGEGVSRRQVMKQMTAAASVGAFGGLAGCNSLQRGSSGGSGGTDETQTDIQETNTNQKQSSGSPPPYQLVELVPPPTELDFKREPPERDITMVTHDASTSFFVPTITGLHDAARQLGWNANFTGPTSGFDVQKQVSLIQSAISNNPDVIATTVADANSYNKVIQEALDNDITVILYNTNALTRKRMRKEFGRTLAYTGQKQVGAGYACGLGFLRELPDDAQKVTVGTCCPGHSALSKREKGIKMAIRQNSDIQVTGTVNYTGKSSEGVSKLENHLTANPDVDGIVGTDAFSWFIGKALKNAGKTDSVVGGGFDLTQQTLDYIKSGVMAMTVGQDPYSQGYIPTVQSFEYLDRGMPPKDYSTGAELINESNIEFALERSGGWSALRNWQKNN